jgi:hypothetical protein
MGQICFSPGGPDPTTHGYGKILKYKEFLAAGKKTLHTYDAAGKGEALRHDNESLSHGKAII